MTCEYSKNCKIYNRVDEQCITDGKNCMLYKYKHGLLGGEEDGKLSKRDNRSNVQDGIETRLQETRKSE